MALTEKANCTPERNPGHLHHGCIIGSDWFVLLGPLFYTENYQAFVQKCLKCINYLNITYP